MPAGLVAAIKRKEEKDAEVEKWKLSDEVKDSSKYRLLHLVSHVMNDARIRGVRSKERDVLSWIDEAGVKNWNEVVESASDLTGYLRLGTVEKARFRQELTSARNSRLPKPPKKPMRQPASRIYNTADVGTKPSGIIEHMERRLAAEDRMRKIREG
jgi:hypothetical protein